jgi:chromosome partitioning protein
MIAGLNGKGLLFGNMKGGVGKTTLCMYILEMIQRLRPKLDVLLIDTDPQASASHMMESVIAAEKIRSMPMGHRYNGAVMSTIDSVIRRQLVQDDSIVMVDTAAGKIGNVWQVALLCNTIIVPTSLSWTDIRPTIDYIQEIDDRKEDYGITTPHIIVVPNRTSPHQRDYSLITNTAKNLNVIIAPPVSDFAVVKHSSHNYRGLIDVEGSRYYDEIHSLADFIISHVMSGDLDRIFAK